MYMYTKTLETMAVEVHCEPHVGSTDPAGSSAVPESPLVGCRISPLHSTQQWSLLAWYSLPLTLAAPL